MNPKESRAGGFLAAFLDWLDSPRAIYAIVGAGLLVRLCGLALVWDTSFRHEARGYEQMALQLLHHENFSPYWPPGVPYYLMLLHKIFGESVLVARAAVLPVYAAFSFVLFALGREVGNTRVGNLAALVFVFDPPYVRYAFDPSTEFPGALCLALVAYLGVKVVRKPSYALAAAWGIILGVLVLVRPSSILLALFASAALFVRSRRAGVALLPVLISAAVISPWLIKTQAMTGRYVMNDSNWENFFFGNNPATPLYRTWPEGQAEVGFPPGFLEKFQNIQSQPPAARAAIYKEISLGYVASRPDLFLLRTVNRARAFWGFPIHRGEPIVYFFGVASARNLLGVGITLVDAAFYWAIMAMAIVFLCNFCQGFFERDDVLILLGAAMVYALPYWVTFAQSRFNFPVVPLFAILAAWLAESIIRNGSEALAPILLSRRRRAALYMALALFLYIQVEWAVVTYARI